MPNKNSVVLGNVKNSLFSDFDSLISHRKDFGIFFTPDWVVDFMVELIPQELLLNSERNNLYTRTCMRFGSVNIRMERLSL